MVGVQPNTTIDLNLTTILVAFFACIPPTLVALAALRSSQKNSQKADVLTDKADIQAVKTAEIHVATNSTLSTLTKSLEVATEKIAGLEKLVAAINITKNETLKAVHEIQNGEQHSPKNP